MTDKYDGAKFVHMRDTYFIGHAHNGGATVAYKTVGGTTYVGVAYCHPKDRYVKAYGRAKAAGYMDQLIERQTIYEDMTYQGQPRQFILPSDMSHEAIISLMAEEGYVPR